MKETKECTKLTTVARRNYARALKTLVRISKIPEFFFDTTMCISFILESYVFTGHTNLEFTFFIFVNFRLDINSEQKSSPELFESS